MVSHDIILLFLPNCPRHNSPACAGLGSPSVSFATGQPMLPVLGISVPEPAPAPPEPPRAREQGSARASLDNLDAGRMSNSPGPALASIPGRTRRQARSESPINPFGAVRAHAPAAMWSHGSTPTPAGPCSPVGPEATEPQQQREFGDGRAGADDSLLTSEASSFGGKM